MDNMLIDTAFAALVEGDLKEIENLCSYNVDDAAQVMHFYEDALPLDMKCRIALKHYDHQGDFYPIIRKYVRRARCIRPDNWRDSLPESVRDLDTFTVYRAGQESSDQEVRCALSWTLSRDVAEWFRNRSIHHGKGERSIFQATIPADKVIAYLSNRNEYEIVQHLAVTDIKKLSPIGESEEFNKCRSADWFTSDHPKTTDYFNRWYRELVA